MRTTPGVVAALAALSLAATACGIRFMPPEPFQKEEPAPAPRMPSAPACAQALPEGLAPPEGHPLLLQLEATGVQIYSCIATDQGPAWTFVAPEAELHAASGAAAGRHFGGPTWQALDGSSVVAAKVSAATPDPTAIPWLLLRATSNAGAGALSKVRYVLRVNTSGGVAPAKGCDAAAVGQVARVPYVASYCFLGGT